VDHVATVMVDGRLPAASRRATVEVAVIDKPIQHRLQFRLRLNLERLAMLVSPPPATTSRGSVEGATESGQRNV
jgi:hypothetical protein